MNPESNRHFSGSIPAIYDEYLVPLIFEPYARDLAERLAGRRLSDVLEVAAGTGVVTRAMAQVLPRSVRIVATDLNQAMLDHAAKVAIARPVTWQQADVMQLPFGDATFDAVVCQFGAMFFPDKAGAFAEIRRVLRPGGVFIFNVWDRISDNEFADTVTAAMATVFPDDPPAFMARIPHGYHDVAALGRDLSTGGFLNMAKFATVTATSRADSARLPAIAYCQGTPLRNEIEVRDAGRLAEATDAAIAAIAGRFGQGPVEGKIQAVVVTVER